MQKLWNKAVAILGQSGCDDVINDVEQMSERSSKKAAASPDAADGRQFGSCRRNQLNP